MMGARVLDTRTPKHDTREAWLREAVEQLGHLFHEATGQALPPVQVSVGWPGGRGDRSNVIGQCWHKDAARDGKHHIFISPVLDEAPRVLDVLAHELVHALDGNESGHKGRFAQWAKAIGLTGRMTATVASDDLARDLARLVAWRLGAYPHGALGAGRLVSGKPGEPGTPEGPGKGGGRSHPPQTTRMLKATCGCDPDPYILRLTRKQAERGMPRCGLCSEVMVLDA